MSEDFVKVTFNKKSTSVHGTPEMIKRAVAILLQYLYEEDEFTEMNAENLDKYVHRIRERARQKKEVAAGQPGKS